MKRIFKFILILPGSIAILFSVLLTFLTVFILVPVIYDNLYKTQIQTLEWKEKNKQYVLMTDLAGFGDRIWYVYQLPLRASINENMREAGNRKASLFWNYSESGIHSDKAKIEIFQKKYLVFSRGNIFYSLYDIKNQQTLVNKNNPWRSYLDSLGLDKPNLRHLSNKQMEEGMNNWVKNNLHFEIKRILTGSE